MAKFHIRIHAVLTLAVGAVTGWLVAAVLYVKFGLPIPPLSLFVMYCFIASQFHWWKELRFRVPASIIGGSMLLSMLSPASVSRRVLIPERPLLSMYEGFCDVNWAMLGAVFFTLVILAIAPMNPDDRFLNSPVSDNGG